MISLLHTVFWVYEIIVIARVLFSWVRVAPYSSLASIRDFVYTLTEPLLRPIRQLLAPYQGRTAFDFSPLVLLVLLSVVERVLIRIPMGPFGH